MGQIESEGIILKTFSLAEADKIVVLLTEKFGLIRGVAKGAKRLKSKFGGVLEPFSIVTAEIYQKDQQELVSIRNLELSKSYFSQASDPLILQKLAYLSELLIEFSPPHDPNVRVYRMAKVCFEEIAKHPEVVDAVVVYFEFWLLQLGGFMPSWDACDICEINFSEGESANLQMNHHLICDRCRKTKSNQIVSFEIRKMYEIIKKSSPHTFLERFGMYPDVVKQMSDILKRLINQNLNREMISQKFLVSSQL